MGFAATAEVLPRKEGLRKAAQVPRIAAVLGSFEELYEEHFDFVWRSVRRLGVPGASMDDAVQDVFLVVHNKRDEFEGRSTVKTWIFGIVVHVARAHRRRRSLAGGDDPD